MERADGGAQMTSWRWPSETRGGRRNEIERSVAGPLAAEMTVGTDRAKPGAAIGRAVGPAVRRAEDGGVVDGQEVACALPPVAAGGTEEAVSADLGETLGQDVLQESGEEVLGGERQPLRLLRAGRDVAEGDPFAIEPLEAVVGDRHAVDVAREVLGGVLTITGVLQVDDPGLSEEVGVDVVEELRFLERVAHLGAEDRCEGVAGDQEVRIRWHAPGAPVVLEAAGGDEQVDVRVVGEVAPPGVEDSEDAEGRTDPARIVGQGLEGVRGLADQQVVHHTLVRTSHGTERGRYGEGGEEVAAGKQTLAQMREPTCRRLAVALRTVAVAAGVVDEGEVVAMIAGEERAAESRCAAGREVHQRSPLRGQQLLAAGRSIRRTRAAHDRRELDHDLMG